MYSLLQPKNVCHKEKPLSVTTQISICITATNNKKNASLPVQPSIKSKNSSLKEKKRMGGRGKRREMSVYCLFVISIVLKLFIEDFFPPTCCLFIAKVNKLVNFRKAGCLLSRCCDVCKLPRQGGGDNSCC